ncbi:DUF6452 family protein [Mesonia aestuariivivens]|uniref:Lipoprotein n=1 Tax=Mesonia aestuariivivens TaxID=2796128 RepID=A0ABS6W0I0_9FLAO|nr:DUF6452 family protein [Mesonia aestuariivivens]MBW2961347.1 hypothetical protein [Mesonia aestuariivivens]
MKKYFILALVAAIFCFTNSCTRDDICPENTQTTPKLVIEFYDIEFPEQPKSVPRINVFADGIYEDYFEVSEDKSSITIPLNTTENFTTYKFIRNSNLPIDSDLVSNIDEIKFTYAVNLSYVSRACGYKAEFLNLNAVLVSESNSSNWIKGIEVRQPNNILNEEDAHIYIYH